MATSQPLVDEVINVLARPYFHSRIDPADIRATVLLMELSLVHITREVHGVATHPADDLVIATALSADAEFVVTGDGPLQRVGSYEGVGFVSPREFLDILRASSA